LGAEHAPQKEGDPQGKATIERAFGTVKNIAGPILDLTSKIAQALPALREPNLAKAATTLLLSALLKAYQAGARATRRSVIERGGVSKQEIAELAERSRKKAIAEDRSIRLLLINIHRDYDIKKPLPHFIRQMRRFALPVLKEAEKGFRSQVHRDDIRDRASYFAAIARSCNEEQRRRLEIEQRQKEQDRQQEHNRCKVDDTNALWRTNPTVWIWDALKALAQQWSPERKGLLLGGAGLGRGWLSSALDRLFELNGPAAEDIALGVFRNFEMADPEHIGSEGMRKIKPILLIALGKKENPETDCKLTFASTILRNTGPPLRPTT